MPGAKFELFLDESGKFLEGSTEPEDIEEALADKNPFASQIVGVLAPARQLDEKTATEVLKASYEPVKKEALPELLHAKDLRNEELNPIVRRLVRQLKSRGWQPVRLVNKEGLTYGGWIQNYTGIFAELVLRIFYQKLREGTPQVSIRIRTAKVAWKQKGKASDKMLDRLGGPNAARVVRKQKGREITQADYDKRLDEALRFAAVRRGLAAESCGWEASVEIGSGIKERRLQICDLLSNASKKDYDRCNRPARKELQEAFGAYDQTLIYPWEMLENIEHHTEEGSLGMALRLLTEVCIRAEGDRAQRPGAQARLERALDLLAEMGAPARDSHLHLLTSWLEQIIDLQRSLDLGHRVTGWLHKNVDDPLRRRLGPPDVASLDWFSYAVTRWALTASNHAGRLGMAKHEAQALDKLMPELAGRWEHATLLIEGVIAQSVHLLDANELERVSGQMELVAGYYGGLSDLFPKLLPQVFNSPVRSDLRGKALGTWLQSEIKRGLVDPSRFAIARGISEQAIEEFSNVADKQRQYQYRCQLETAAGELKEARKYLSQSLGLQETTHAAIADAVKSLADRHVAQGFALLHWLRLGVACLLSEDEEERRRFLKALRSSQLLDSPWCLGKITAYPAHGIIRRVAAIRANQGQREEALTALKRIGKVKGRALLELIKLAAYAEVAGLLWDSDPDCSRSILSDLREVVDPFKRGNYGFPSLVRMVEEWPHVIDKLLKEETTPEVARETLLQLARPVAD